MGNFGFYKVLLEIFLTFDFSQPRLSLASHLFRTPIEDIDAEEEDGMEGKRGNKGIYKKYVAALGRGISAWTNRA